VPLIAPLNEGENRFTLDAKSRSSSCPYKTGYRALQKAFG
jgi:hypothetical protein